MANFGVYQSIPGLICGSTSLAAYQYYPVKLGSAAGTVALAATKTDAIGILQNDPAAGEPADVAFAGICKVVAGAMSTAGEFLAVSSTSNRVVLAAGANTRILGYNLESVAATGDVIRMVLSISNL